MSPITYLQEFGTPVQLHHAIDDSVVSVQYARQLKASYEQIGKILELYEYPSGGHDIEGPAFSQAMQRTAAFYELHL